MWHGVGVVITFLPGSPGIFNRSCLVYPLKKKEVLYIALFANIVVSSARMYLICLFRNIREKQGSNFAKVIIYSNIKLGLLITRLMWVQYTTVR